MVPPADTCQAQRQLSDLQAELDRVVHGIAKVGMSAALESKLTELEAHKRDLTAEIQAAERTIELPEMSVIVATWRRLVKDLGNLPKIATPAEVASARDALKGILGTIHVDRAGKGYAELGLPTGMVAGAGISRFMPWVKLRVAA